MENLKYYKDLDNDVLLAYEKTTEFFVIYNFEKREWVSSNISFSNFKHDYYFKEIREEEVKEKTSGNLPNSIFLKYIEMINKNKEN